MFKIEKGIRIPGEKSPWGTVKATLVRMEVGDSFLVKSSRKTQHVRSAMSKLHKNTDLGRRFISQTTPDGIRVWRIT